MGNVERYIVAMTHINLVDETNFHKDVDVVVKKWKHPKDFANVKLFAKKKVISSLFFYLRGT